MTFSVVVTGASGFIGGALVESLKNERDVEVVPISRSRNDGTHICVDDYRNTPKGDVLVHLAEDPDRSRVNAIGERYCKESGAIMDMLLSKGFGKVIYCSSATVYGDLGKYPYSEESPVKPVDHYVSAKLQNENRVLTAVGVVARISNVIGPKMAPNNVVSDILTQLLGSDPITVHNERPVRDFVWIDDVVDGLKKLISQGVSGIYNIGSGQGTSVRELVRVALSISGQQSRMIKSMASAPPSSSIVLDISTMKQMLGWVPKKNVYQCMERLINMKIKIL